MIANLRPYPEYKESEQAWLGRVPKHWPVLPNRALFTEVKDREHPDEEMLSVTITKGIIRQKALLTDSSKKDSSRQDKSAYKLVQPRDIAYNKMRAWQGAIGASELRGIISPAYVVMRLREERNLPRYFHHLYRTPQFAKEAERWSYGITSDMWSLRPEHFKMIYTPQPPPEEQAPMVRFLDYANGRLERAIRAKRKVIALLHEQKQAIIHRAVTRGLDPTVSLKPSGIPWLGEIPEHWEVTRLKFEATHIVDCLHATPKYIHDGPFPAIRTADIEAGKVRLSQARRLSAQEYARWTSRLVPREGDILYSREGEHFGIAALVPKEVQLCISQRMMIFRIKSSQLSEFLMWQLNCKHVFAQASCDLIGSTAPHVNVEQIKNYRLVMPPRQEQDQIVAYIAEECSTLNTAISRLEREISLLREYRTRLVADVVTGKVVVRPAARQLPAEPFEPAAVPETEELTEPEPEDASD